MRKLIVIIIAIFAMFVAKGITKQGEADKVYGCYQKNDGQLRIVDDHSKCRGSEIAISWEKMGQKGEKEAAGYAGDKGIPKPFVPEGSIGYRAVYNNQCHNTSECRCDSACDLLITGTASCDDTQGHVLDMAGGQILQNGTKVGIYKYEAHCIDKETKLRVSPAVIKIDCLPDVQCP
jgi:hypothetical protein